MSRPVQARLAKLEAAAPAPGHVIPMFAWGKTKAEIEAEQANMVRRGLASPGDNFQVFTWMDPLDASDGATAGAGEGLAVSRQSLPALLVAGALTL